jgi:hypothetical protein
MSWAAWLHYSCRQWLGPCFASSRPYSQFKVPLCLETISLQAAVDGAPIERSRVYVAPPDHHLTVNQGSITVEQGPRENGFRPAIDPMFRSAAKSYDGRVVGVILSGALDDGTFGLTAVKQAGGAAIVQHPYEAFVPSMPLSSLAPSRAAIVVMSSQRRWRRMIKRPFHKLEEGLTPGPKAQEENEEKIIVDQSRSVLFACLRFCVSILIAQWIGRFRKRLSPLHGATFCRGGQCWVQNLTLA